MLWMFKKVSEKKQDTEPCVQHATIYIFKSVYNVYILEKLHKKPVIAPDFEKGNQEKRQEKDIFQTMPFLPFKFCTACALIIQKSNPFFLLPLLPPPFSLLLGWS